MRELSLFSGGGGGLIASKHLLNWRTVGYVEFNEDCQEIIAQRIKDNLLDEAPIFSDVRTFISEGYAEAYKGMVDICSGGFPCQPFSVAGRQKGADDSRNMFPQVIEIAKIVRSRLLFLENVPTLLNCGYFPTVLSSLSEAGYDARWMCLGADDVGARHRRKRLWLRCELADSNSKPRRQG